jgi:hypothetical protein
MSCVKNDKIAYLDLAIKIYKMDQLPNHASDSQIIDRIKKLAQLLQE